MAMRQQMPRRPSKEKGSRPRRRTPKMYALCSSASPIGTRSATAHALVHSVRITSRLSEAAAQINVATVLGCKSTSSVDTCLARPIQKVEAFAHFVACGLPRLSGNRSISVRLRARTRSTCRWIEGRLRAVATVAYCWSARIRTSGVG
jgi:hypothetical protein